MRINRKTDRPKKNNDSYFGRVSKRSIKKDFNETSAYTKEEPRQEIDEQPTENSERRVAYINETSAYARYARFFVGKLVRLKRPATFGGNSWYVEFVFDDDRKALNKFADWTTKTEYLLDGVKFK